MTGVESICIFPEQPNKDRYTFHRGSGFLCFAMPINHIMLLCFCFGTRNFLVLHRKKRGAPRFLKKRFATPPFSIVQNYIIGRVRGFFSMAFKWFCSKTEKVLPNRLIPSCNFSSEWVEKHRRSSLVVGCSA